MSYSEHPITAVLKDADPLSADFGIPVAHAGSSGENGATFTPSVSDEGIISWTNDKGLPNPTSVNIKGPQGAQGEQGIQGVKGNDGEKGDKGDVGPQGPQGIQGIQGEKGEPGEQGEPGAKGDKGDPFSIAKIYPSVEAMNAGYATDGISKGSFVVIDTGNVNDEENARLYIKGDSAYVFLTDLSGAQGLQGPQGPQGEKGETGAKGDTGSQGVQGVQGLQGERGENGKDGNGISSIEKTNTNGLVDTYTIKYTNGDTSTFKVTNGADGSNGAKGDTGDTGADGFSPTVQISKSGKVTTISITDKDGTKNAQINDGADGKDGTNGENGKDGTSVTVASVSESDADGGSNVVTFSDGKTLTVKNGSKGSPGEKGDTGEQGIQGEKGDKGDKGDTGETGAAGKDGEDYVLTEADKAEIAEMVGGIIPDYWQSALDNGVEGINTALCSAGFNKSAFLFYSDVHWNFGSQMSPKLLKYLYEHTGMTKTFFGGDVVNVEGADYDTMKYLWDWRNQIKGLPNHHSVVGNHDDGNSTNNLFSEKYVYGYLLAAEETVDIVREKGLYYYIDSPTEKTRYLFLDTAYKGAVSHQQEFIKEALINTPESWHIVAVSHIWYDTIYTTSPPSVGGLNSNASIFLSMFDNYNNRSGDYADCKGWVEFCIGGHTHQDYDGTSESGIPIILVETDSRDVRNGKTEAQYKYTAGTATESSVNGIIADYDDHKIYVVRIGRGESRVILITNYEVNYTNQVPLSTDASGAIYDGKGYKDGIRLGSDGADRTGAATDATGFIPCTTADTLYFKNCQIAVLGGASTTYQNIGCYDSTKTFINTRFVDMASQMSGKDYSVDSNNYLTRYNCADLWANTAFVRITGNYIGADSIITKNEPLE